jgi:hypothetical protein
MIPASERILRAQALIQKAYQIPVPEEGGKHDLSYVASVRDTMQQARDLVKFIPFTPTATDEMKAQVRQIYADAERAVDEILHGNPS